MEKNKNDQVHNQVKNKTLNYWKNRRDNNFRGKKMCPNPKKLKNKV